MVFTVCNETPCLKVYEGQLVQVKDNQYIETKVIGYLEAADYNIPVRDEADNITKVAVEAYKGARPFKCNDAGFGTCYLGNSITDFVMCDNLTLLPEKGVLYLVVVNDLVYLYNAKTDTTAKFYCSLEEINEDNIQFAILVSLTNLSTDFSTYFIAYSEALGVQHINDVESLKDNCSSFVHLKISSMFIIDIYPNETGYDTTAVDEFSEILGGLLQTIDDNKISNIVLNNILVEYDSVTFNEALALEEKAESSVDEDDFDEDDFDEDGFDEEEEDFEDDFGEDFEDEEEYDEDYDADYEDEFDEELEDDFEDVDLKTPYSMISKSLNSFIEPYKGAQHILTLCASLAEELDYENFDEDTTEEEIEIYTKLLTLAVVIVCSLKYQGVTNMDNDIIQTMTLAQVNIFAMLFGLDTPSKEKVKMMSVKNNFLLTGNKPYNASELLWDLLTKALKEEYESVYSFIYYMLSEYNISGGCNLFAQLYRGNIPLIVYNKIKQEYGAKLKYADFAKYFTVDHLLNPAITKKPDFKYEFEYNNSMGVLDTVATLYIAFASCYDIPERRFVSDLYNMIAAPNKIVYDPKKGGLSMPRVTALNTRATNRANLACLFSISELDFEPIHNEILSDKSTKTFTQYKYMKQWSTMSDYIVYGRHNWKNFGFRDALFVSQLTCLYPLFALNIDYDDKRVPEEYDFDAHVANEIIQLLLLISSKFFSICRITNWLGYKGIVERKFVMQDITDAVPLSKILQRYRGMIDIFNYIFHNEKAKDFGLALNELYNFLTTASDILENEDWSVELYQLCKKAGVRINICERTLKGYHAAPTVSQPEFKRDIRARANAMFDVLEEKGIMQTCISFGNAVNTFTLYDVVRQMFPAGLGSGERCAVSGAYGYFCRGYSRMRYCMVPIVDWYLRNDKTIFLWEQPNKYFDEPENLCATPSYGSLSEYELPDDLGYIEEISKRVQKVLAFCNNEVNVSLILSMYGDVTDALCSLLYMTCNFVCYMRDESVLDMYLDLIKKGCEYWFLISGSSKWEIGYGPSKYSTYDWRTCQKQWITGLKSHIETIELIKRANNSAYSHITRLIKSSDISIRSYSTYLVERIVRDVFDLCDHYTYPWVIPAMNKAEAETYVKSLMSFYEMSLYTFVKTGYWVKEYTGF